MYDIARTIFFFFSFRWGKKKGLESIRKWMRLAAAIMKTVIVETTHVRKGSAEARRGGRGAAPSGCGGARQGRVVTRRSWGSVTARRYLRTPNRTPSPSLCEATCLWFRGKDRTSGTWGRVLSSERIQQHARNRSGKPWMVYAFCRFIPRAFPLSFFQWYLLLSCFMALHAHTRTIRN